MYKRMTRFMQTELGIAHHESETGRKKKRPPKVDRGAKRKKEMEELGLSGTYLTAISPLISSFDRKPKQIARELNTRGIKMPNTNGH